MQTQLKVISVESTYCLPEVGEVRDGEAGAVGVQTFTDQLKKKIRKELVKLPTTLLLVLPPKLTATIRQ